MKLRVWMIAGLAGTRSLLAQQDDLPKRAPGDGLDFEPKLMLDGPHIAVAAPTAPPEDRVEQLKEALLRAEQRAGGSEQLYKEGILAQVEVEARTLRVIEIRKELADASVSLAAAQADAAKKAFDAREATQAEMDVTAARLKTAQEGANAAAADWHNAQVGAAAIDLKRKRTLYSEGVESRHAVDLAVARLARLSGTAAKP
jgi:hypothetical protein